MSHQQLSHVQPAQPPWLKPIILIVGACIMTIAGFMSIFTQSGLAGRIPDWSDFGWLLPVACWLYTALSTIIWAASPHGTRARDTAFNGVLIAAGISELMNVGEHAWVYIDTHSVLDWGFFPLFLVGSIPTGLEVLSVHLIASVLSDHAPSEEAADEEPASSEEPLPQPEETSDLPKEPVPADLPKPEPKKPEPVLPDPEPEPEISPKPEPKIDDSNKVHKISTRRQARRELVEKIAGTVSQMMEAGDDLDKIKKTLNAKHLTDTYPDRTYSDRNWLFIRDDAIEEAAKTVQVA